MADLNVNDIADAAGTGPVNLYKQVAAKLWCAFDGTAGTVVAGDSLNVASITDSGTGNYEVNATSAFASTDHGLVVSSSTYMAVTGTLGVTASVLPIDVYSGIGTRADTGRISCNAVGDLA